jgi:hypothetical protein
LTTVFPVALLGGVLEVASEVPAHRVSKAAARLIFMMRFIAVLLE